MSDREASPTHSGSNQSPKPLIKRSPSGRSRSRSRDRSRSPSEDKHKIKEYSHSRSPSPAPKSRRMSSSYRKYRSRSRSRSPRKYRSRYSHSRSRSFSPRGGSGNGNSSRYYGGYSDRRKEFFRSHSRSPMSNRRRHVGNRMGRKGQPSWHVQLRGVRRWRLYPPPECFYECQQLQLAARPGEILIVDTGRWHAERTVVSDEVSIAINAPIHLDR